MGALEAKAFIREKRIRLGLYQRELAEVLGVSRATVMRWESGKQRIYQRHYDKLKALAKSDDAVQAFLKEARIVR